MEVKKEWLGGKETLLEDEIDALLSQQSFFEEEVVRKGVTLGVSSDIKDDSHKVDRDGASEERGTMIHGDDSSFHKKKSDKASGREAFYLRLSFLTITDFYMTNPGRYINVKEGEKISVYNSRKEINNEGSVSLHGDRMFGDEFADHPGKSSHTTGDDIAKEALRSLSRKIRRSGTPKSRLEMLKADFRSSGVLALSYTGLKHSDYGGVDTQYYARAQPCLFGYCVN